MRGYYICECKNEAVRLIPYDEIKCFECGQSIKLTKEITESEEDVIKDRWMQEINEKLRGFHT